MFLNAMANLSSISLETLFSLTKRAHLICSIPFAVYSLPAILYSCSFSYMLFSSLLYTTKYIGTVTIIINPNNTSAFITNNALIESSITLYTKSGKLFNKKPQIVAPSPVIWSVKNAESLSSKNVKELSYIVWNILLHILYKKVLFNFVITYVIPYSVSIENKFKPAIATTNNIIAECLSTKESMYIPLTYGTINCRIIVAIVMPMYAKMLFFKFKISFFKRTLILMYRNFT